MGALAEMKTMNRAMEDKIKEGYYALCLAILKGYSVSEAFHALEMPNWKVWKKVELKVGLKVVPKRKTISPAKCWLMD